MKKQTFTLMSMNKIFIAIVQFIPTKIRRRIPNSIKLAVNRLQRHESNRRPALLTNVWVSESGSRYATKRALVSYITHPFRTPVSNNVEIQFSNSGLARSIVKVLNESGYVVDLVDWDDESFLPCGQYDLFIGHGGCNYKHIAQNLFQDTSKIYFATGIYWREFNRREHERFQALYDRKAVSLPYDRWIYYSEEYANQNADGIICLGNNNVKDSFSKFSHVLCLNNAAYPDDHFNLTKKDYSAGRNNFLFFAGAGNVHKGLDLLLEAFSQTTLHLWICQDIRADFFEAYHRELLDYPNIHQVGTVGMRSTQFYDLVNECNFVILPSCAEGQPGSVIECMHQGLIPIVSRESNIDTGDFGITLNTCTIAEILQTIKAVSTYNSITCESMSMRTRQIAQNEYSAESFLRNFSNALQDIISSTKYS